MNNNFNNIIFNNFRANQLPGAARVVCDNQNAAGGMLGFGAAMETDAAALWNILYDRQKAAELR